MYFLHQALFLTIEALRYKRLDTFVEAMQPLNTKKEAIPWVQLKAASVLIIPMISCPRSQKRGFCLCGYQHESWEDLFGLSCSHIIIFLCNSREETYFRTVTEHHTVLAINFQK